MTNKVAIAFLEGLKTYQLRTEREALDMAIEALEQEPKWIPVTERLPTLNDDGVSDMVLLCWSDGQRTVGAYRGDRTFVGQAWPVAKDVSVTVTAWMPLPESYEEKSEQLESDEE